MPIVSQPSAPSTLADVIEQVIEALSDIGDAIPVQVGKHYLESFGVGSGPKILFVPEAGGSAVSNPVGGMGRPVSWIHSCDVHVRARETKPDVERYRAAYLLADKVIGLISVATTGRVLWGKAADDSPTKVDAFGAGLSFSFAFARDILHNAARWSLPAADTDSGGAIPKPPPGNPANGAIIIPHTDGEHIEEEEE